MNNPSPTPALTDAQLRRYVLIGVCVAVLLAAWGIVSRLMARNALEHQAIGRRHRHCGNREPDARACVRHAGAARRGAGVL